MSEGITYLPFLNGLYSVAPGLQSIAKAKSDYDKKIFQIDDSYQSFIQNKKACRTEDIRKYFLESNFSLRTQRAITDYIIRQLLEEYDAFFQLRKESSIYRFTNCITGQQIVWNTNTQKLEDNEYSSLFDALCSQVPEDIAVCQLHENTDQLVAIHLCSPNHWSPAEKIGKSFAAVHEPVAGMEKVIANAPKMLQMIVEKGTFTRFAWGLSTDTRLNHHPRAPAGVSAEDWIGRQIEKEGTLFIRTERQNLIGFPEQNAFLFTIRTYFYPVSKLDAKEKKALLAAVQSMSEESLKYKGMKKAEMVLKHQFGL